MLRTEATAPEAIFQQRLARCLEERRYWPQHRYPNINNHVSIGLGVMFLALAAAVPVAARDPAETVGVTLVIAAIGALFFGAGVARVLSEARLDASLLRGVATLLAQRSGQELTRPLTWLNDRWAGPATVDLVFGGSLYRALRFEPLGYEVVLVLNPVPARGQRPSMSLLLAAWIPGVSERDAPDPGVADSWRSAPGAASPLSALERAGFEVEPSVAGILCRATPDAVRRLRQAPEEVALLGAAIVDIARLAAAIGARPPPKGLGP